MELKPVHHVPAKCCVPGERKAPNFPASFCDPSYLLLWACTPAPAELTSSGYAFSRMLASVWQSGQIHALGITRLLWSSASQKEILQQITSCSGEHREQQCLRQYRILSCLDLSSVQGHLDWGQSPLKVRNIPFFCAVFLQAPGVLPDWFCCKSA